MMWGGVKRVVAYAGSDTMTSMVATRQPVSPQAAARYLERWAIARERLDEELRATSMEAKLHQLANLMQSAGEMGWSRSLDEEDDAGAGEMDGAQKGHAWQRVETLSRRARPKTSPTSREFWKFTTDWTLTGFASG